MLPLRPEYAATDSLPSSNVLGIIRFGEVTDLVSAPAPVLTLSLPPLAADDGSAEVWLSASAVRYGRRGGVAFARNDEVMFAAILDGRDDVEVAAREAYESIVDVSRAEGFPHLLRVWNHVCGVNRGSGDLERYRRFCHGRREAFVAAGLQKHEFPAASAVGMRTGGMAVYWLAGRSGGRQIENPRQVSAYEYPRQYGRSSPSFARATVARWDGEALLFISGTASIVGHETRHLDDLDAQLDETVRNLDAVLGESGARRADVRSMKVYVRHRADAERIAAGVRVAFPGVSVLLVEGEICRRELLLEIEAVAALRR